MGADFLILFECKRHATPVKREHVQVLHAKLASVGAQKGVVVAAAGFQRGALEYARAHGIACVRLVDDSWLYETRDMFEPAPTPSGSYAAYARSLTDAGYQNRLLTNERVAVRDLLFDEAAAE